MRDGLKRNIKYLTRYQARMTLMYAIGALVYGIAMAVFMADPGEEMQTVCKFFGFFLSITMVSQQLNFMLCVPPMALSMGSTRRDLIIGHRVMSVELAAEMTVLLTIAFFLAGREDGVSLLFCLMRSLISVLYISASGVMMGMLLPRNGKEVGVAVLIGMVFGFIIIGCTMMGDEFLRVIEAIVMGRKAYLWAAGIAVILLALVFIVIVYGAAARRIRRMEVRC